MLQQQSLDSLAEFLAARQEPPNISGSRGLGIGDYFAENPHELDLNQYNEIFRHVVVPDPGDARVYLGWFNLAQAKPDPLFVHICRRNQLKQRRTEAIKAGEHIRERFGLARPTLIIVTYNFREGREQYGLCIREYIYNRPSSKFLQVDTQVRRPVSQPEVPAYSFA